MRTNSVLKGLAGVATAGLLLSGCTGDPAGDPAGAESKTKVVYWSQFNVGEPLQILLEEIIDDFEDENPDIDIEVNWAGRDVLTQLQGAVQAGTQVDIVDHSNDRVRNAVVVNDLALNLDKYFQEPSYGETSGSWIDDYAQGAVDAFAEDDGLYLVPREAYISGIWYNADILADVGIVPSATGTTWEEFSTYLETIAEQAPGVSPLGADGSIDFYNNWWFSYLAIRMAGVEAFKGAANDETGESWKQPEFLQAAEMVRELQDRGYFQDGFEGSVFPAMQAQFANGEVAMMQMGAWIPKELGPQLSEDFNMKVFAFPNVAGGLGNNLVESWANVFVVMKETENPDAAVTFLKYVMAPEKGGATLLEAGYPVPLAGANVAEEYAGQVEILGEYETMGERGGLNNTIPAYMTDVLNLCNDSFFLMETSPAEFMDCLASESSGYWSANPQQDE